MAYIPIYLRTDLQADPPQYQDNHNEAFSKVNSNMEAFDLTVSTTVETVTNAFQDMLDEAIEEIQSQAVPYHTHYLTGGIDCGLVTEEETPINIRTVDMDAVYLNGGSFEE